MHFWHGPLPCLALEVPDFLPYRHVVMLGRGFDASNTAVTGADAQTAAHRARTQPDRADKGA